MRTHLLLIPLFFLAAVLLLGLAACGGAAGTAETPIPVEEPTDPAPEPEVPADPALDVQLLQVLAERDLDPPPTAPARTDALVALGRALFFDKLLSGNRDIACSTCHHPSAGTGDALSVSIGAGGTGTGAARQLASGSLIPRNAPALFNRGLPGVDQMFWDSRVRRRGGRNGQGGQGAVLETPEPALNGPAPLAAAIASQLDTALAAQALFPLLSGAEMRGETGENEIADAASNLEAWALLMVRLVGSQNGTVGGNPTYRTLFEVAFPTVVDVGDFNIGHVGRAIGAYEESAFEAMASPFDAYLAGDTTALSDEAKRGALLFYGRADCSRCHGGPLFTDNRHHAIAIPQVGPGRDFPGEDIGREAVSADPDDRYAFRTPSLRNVELTGPWMHDGAFTSLEAVIAHYDNPVASLQNYDASQLAPLLRATVDRNVTRNQARADALSNILRPAPRIDAQDVQRLAAFLRALTDPASRDLSAEIPSAVPSGLPVGD